MQVPPELRQPGPPGWVGWRVSCRHLLGRQPRDLFAQVFDGRGDDGDELRLAHAALHFAAHQVTARTLVHQRGVGGAAGGGAGGGGGGWRGGGGGRRRWARASSTSMK